jgi:hypothetical protein
LGYSSAIVTMSNEYWRWSVASSEAMSQHLLGELKKTTKHVITAQILSDCLPTTSLEASSLQLTWALTPENQLSCVWRIRSYLMDALLRLPYTETCLLMKLPTGRVESLKGTELVPPAARSCIPPDSSSRVASAIQLIQNYQNKKVSVGWAAYVWASLWHAHLCRAR